MKNHKFRKKKLRRHLLWGCVLLSSGCVTRTLNEDVIEQHMLMQQPQQALAELESRTIKERDYILYFLDKAILLRMQGHFAASNAALEEAKSVAAQTEALSLREQAGAFSINDAQRSYALSDFERALLYCIKSINYLELQQAQEARVEVLQLTEWLKQHEKIKLPFARYLSGLVFEFTHQPDEALIAYRQAYEEYRQLEQAIPLILQQDLLRLTDHLHVGDEHQRYASEFGDIRWLSQERFTQHMPVTLILFNGLMPRRHSQEMAIQSPSDGQIHRISVPFYEKRVAPVTHAYVVSIKNRQSSELLAALDEQAAQALENDMPAIVARTIARTGVKNKLMNEAADQNPMLGLALNVAAFVSETADTRGWYTLPQQLLIDRVLLDVNKSQDITLQLSGSALPNAQRTWHIPSTPPHDMRLFSWHWTESERLQR